MIECKIDKNKFVAKIVGTPSILTAELERLILALYRGLDSDDGSNDVRERFRGKLLRFLADPDSQLFEAEEPEDEGEGDED